ncbi:hypothetical protein ACFPM0_11495 [Pseudonocardia sulfidoxydans]|uniref:hypothetical protein n=1 Tax=Pseudonocardia sulfidoxydans TaxID=54011 RepID=UPI00361662BD
MEQRPLPGGRDLGPHAGHTVDLARLQSLAPRRQDAAVLLVGTCHCTLPRRLDAPRTGRPTACGFVREGMFVAHRAGTGEESSGVPSDSAGKVRNAVPAGHGPCARPGMVGLPRAAATVATVVERRAGTGSAIADFDLGARS